MYFTPKILLFLVLFVLQIKAVFANNEQNNLIHQEFYTRFLNFDQLNGLSNNLVLDILQDPYGFIWIATADGLNRFDGYNFKVYLHSDTDSASIAGDFITSLTLDYKHNLWIGTKNGLCKYHRATETFEHFPIQSQSSNGISNAHVRCVYADDTSETLWVETVDGTLNKINLSDYQIVQIKHKKIGTTYYNYHSIIKDSKGDVWFGGRAMGPYKLDTTGRLTLLKADSNNRKKKRDNDIACVYEDDKNRMWMSATDGFYRYFRQSNIFKKHLAVSTFDIVADAHQNLWLATGSGLFYFNTTTEQFISYKQNITDPYSLIGNHVNCVFIDRQNNVWAGTNNGISIIEKKKNTIKFFRSLPENKASVPTSPVSDFLQDKRQNIWIATMGNGLIKWNRTDNTFISYADKFGGKRVSCLYEDRQNNIWIGLWSGRGFYKFNRQDETFEHYAINYNSLKSDWYNDFYEDAKGRLWLGVWGSRGVTFFDRDSAKIKKYSLRLNESPHNWPVFRIWVTPNKVWASSRYQTVYALNKKKQAFSCWNKYKITQILPEWRHLYNDSATTLFHANMVYQIMAPSDSIAYFATQNGLIQYRNGKFRLFKEVLNPISTLSAVDERQLFFFASANNVYQYNTQSGDVNLIYTLSSGSEVLSLLSQNGMLYIGLKKGLLKYDLRRKILTKIPKITGEIHAINSMDQQLIIGSTTGVFVVNQNENTLYIYNLASDFKNGLASDYIQTLFCDKKRRICYLGTDKGALIFDVNRKSFESISQLDGVAVHQIYAINSDTVWFGTDLGLVRYNVRRNSTKAYNTFTKHQTTSRLTQFIFEDSQNNVWIGSTNNSLSRLNTQTYEIDHFLSDPDNPNALWGKNTTAICELDDGRILIGAKGINVYHYGVLQFTHLTENNGFPSNEILAMVQDDNRNIWVSTPSGLVRLTENLKIIDVYHTDWGLEPYKFTKAMLKLQSGEILVGAKSGFYDIDPNLIKTITDSSQIQITGLSIYNKERYADFTDKKAVAFNYDENFFTIRFTDFTYQNTNPEFLYKLYGIDKDWVNSDKKNYAIYTKIPPGNYTFVVKKKNQLNIKPATLQIKINPPFWKTYWFMAIEIVLALLVIYLVYQQQINKYKMREKHLILEQTLLRSQMNPHFVFNALIAIQSFILKNNPKEAGRYLSKFAKLIRLFLQNTRAEYIKLSVELETLSHYLEMQKLRFNDAFDYEISCVEQIDPDLISIPPMMAQPFIENAIEHGFSGINYRGLINIKYYFHDNHIRITILDNGIGIKAAMQKKGYNQNKHKSLATEITRDRLKTWSTRKQKFTLEIVDRSQLITNEQGTKVTLRVPFKNINYE